MPTTEPIICPAIIFSDSVIREQGTGKISIIGSFTQFNFPSFPAACPPFVVTILLSRIPGPIEHLPLTVRIEAMGSANVLQSMSGELHIQDNITINDVLEITVPVPPTVFVQPGVYEVHVFIEGQPLNHRPLLVKSISTSPQISP